MAIENLFARSRRQRITHEFFRQHRRTIISLAFVTEALWRLQPDQEIDSSEPLDQINSLGDQAVLVLVGFLNESAIEYRRASAFVLGQLTRFPERTNLADAVPALLAATKDQDDWVRFAAATSLFRIGQDTDRVVQVAAQTLGNEDVRLRRAATVLLAQMTKSPIAVDALAKALDDSDEEVRETSMRALADLGEHAAAALPSLHKKFQPDAAFVRDAEPNTLRFQACRAIGAIDPAAYPSVFPFLRDASLNGNFMERRRAMECFASLGTKVAPALPLVIDTLADPDDGLISLACDALSSLGELASSAVPALIDVLVDQRGWQAKESACQALGAIGPKANESIPALHQIAKDHRSSKEVRLWAAWAVWKIEGNQDLAETMARGVLAASDPDLEWEATSILAEIKDK